VFLGKIFVSEQDMGGILREKLIRVCGGGGWLLRQKLYAACWRYESEMGNEN